MNPQERKYFWYGTSLGAGALALFFLAFVQLYFLPKLKAGDASIMASFDKVVALNAACQARFAEATVISDFAPMRGLTVGPITLQPQTAGQLVGSVRPRWYIPARVQPVVYGEAQGAEYYYYDPKTQQTHGPFTPQMHR